MLPLLTDAERTSVADRMESHGKPDYSKDTCIHQFFEAQAERTPDAVAVTFEDKRLDVPRTESTSKSTCTLLASTRCRARCFSRYLHGAVLRNDRGLVGSTQSRRCLCSLGP